MVIHHRTVIAQGAIRQNSIDRQFGKIVVTLEPKHDL
jgi:hypothetical protein